MNLLEKNIWSFPLLSRIPSWPVLSPRPSMEVKVGFSHRLFNCFPMYCQLIRQRLKAVQWKIDVALLAFLCCGVILVYYVGDRKLIRWVTHLLIHLFQFGCVRRKSVFRFKSNQKVCQIIAKKAFTVEKARILDQRCCWNLRKTHCRQI